MALHQHPRRRQTSHGSHNTLAGRTAGGPFGIHLGKGDELRRQPLVFRGHGGGVRAGQPAVVGELGPELFVPRTDGTVVPRRGFDTGLTNEALLGFSAEDIIEALLGQSAQRRATPSRTTGFEAQPAGAADADPSQVGPFGLPLSPLLKTGTEAIDPPVRSTTESVVPGTAELIAAIAPSAIGAIGSLFGGDDPTTLNIRRGPPQIVDIFSQLGIQGQDRADINAQLAPLIMARLLALLIPSGASPDTVAAITALRGDPSTNPNTGGGPRRNPFIGRER